MMIKGAMLFTGIVSVLLCLVVYRRNQKSIINKSFVKLILMVSFWIFSIFLFLQYPNIFWGKLIYIEASIIPILFLKFVNLFPSGKEAIKRKEKYTLYPLAGISILLSASSLIVEKLVKTNWGFTFKLGSLYFIFFIYKI